jgi:hypothetical protein
MGPLFFSVSLFDPGLHKGPLSSCHVWLCDRRCSQHWSLQRSTTTEPNLPRIL